MDNYHTNLSHRELQILIDMSEEALSEARGLVGVTGADGKHRVFYDGKSGELQTIINTLSDMQWSELRRNDAN